MLNVAGPAIFCLRWAITPLAAHLELPMALAVGKVLRCAIALYQTKIITKSTLPMSANNKNNAKGLGFDLALCGFCFWMVAIGIWLNIVGLISHGFGLLNGWG